MQRLAALALPAGLPGLLAGCAAVSPATESGGVALAPWPDRPVLLLGEIHDNPDHHRLRAAGLVAWMRAAEALGDRRPTVVAFEPLLRARGDALRSAYQALGLLPAGLQPAHPLAARDWPTEALQEAADRLADAGGLDRRGWGWPLHRPLVMACVQAGARVVGANLEVAEARDIARRGDAALPQDLRRVLDADRAWSAREQQATEAEIDRGHCGLLPPARWPAMALAQRARDAAMALAVVEAVDGGRSRVVLVAGNGHVRRDLGVPRSLVALGLRGRDLQAVGYLEAPATATATAAATAAPSEPRLAERFDQVVYTAARDRPDPCEGLARRL